MPDVWPWCVRRLTPALGAKSSPGWFSSSKASAKAMLNCNGSCNASSKPTGSQIFRGPCAIVAEAMRDSKADRPVAVNDGKGVRVAGYHQECCLEGLGIEAQLAVPGVAPRCQPRGRFSSSGHAAGGNDLVQDEVGCRLQGLLQKAVLDEAQVGPCMGALPTGFSAARKAYIMQRPSGGTESAIPSAAAERGQVAPRGRWKAHLVQEDARHHLNAAGVPECVLACPCLSSESRGPQRQPDASAWRRRRYAVTMARCSLMEHDVVPSCTSCLADYTLLSVLPEPERM